MISITSVWGLSLVLVRSSDTVCDVFPVPILQLHPEETYVNLRAEPHFKEQGSSFGNQEIIILMFFLTKQVIICCGSNVPPQNTHAQNTILVQHCGSLRGE